MWSGSRTSTERLAGGSGVLPSWGGHPAGLPGPPARRMTGTSASGDLRWMADRWGILLQAPPPPAAAPGGRGSRPGGAPPLRPRYGREVQLRRFVDGEHNEAGHCAWGVAGEGPPGCTPPLLYGGVGLGKTTCMLRHRKPLLEGQPSRNIGYVPKAKEFMNQLVTLHPGRGPPASYRRRYGRSDLPPGR